MPIVLIPSPLQTLQDPQRIEDLSIVEYIGNTIRVDTTSSILHLAYPIRFSLTIRLEEFHRGM